MPAMYVACDNKACARWLEGRCRLDTINLKAVGTNGEASGYIRCLNFLARTRPLEAAAAPQAELALGGVR